MMNTDSSRELFELAVQDFMADRDDDLRLDDDGSQWDEDGSYWWHGATDDDGHSYMLVDDGFGDIEIH